MARFIGILCGLFLLVSAPVHAAVFHPKTFTLANGLRFIVVENRISPAVSQMVWYKAGSADEELGRSGVAHYLEHLMFRGTKTIPAGWFSRIIAAQGGNDNAFTSHDYTAYYETIANDRLAMIMQMEADRMQNLQIDPQTAITELKVVLSERQERTDNDPQGIFAERIRHALFGNNKYGIPVIGWKEEIEKITVDNARKFYDLYYSPSNAVVVISGNVKLQEVMRLAAGTYGRVPARDVPLHVKFPKVAEPQEKRVVMKDVRIHQPRLEIHIIAPSYSTQENREAYALEVLAEALGGGEVGELFRQLVVKQKMASAVDIHYDPQARGQADFAVFATPYSGKSAEELENMLVQTLEQIAKKGLSVKAVEAAKERLIRTAIFARDSLTAPGYILGEALVIGQKIEDAEAWPERIKAVTAKEVNIALRKIVSSQYRVIGFLLPDSSAETKAEDQLEDSNQNFMPEE